MSRNDTVHIVRFLAVLAGGLPLILPGCGRGPASEYVEFAKAHDFKKDDPRASTPPVPPEVEILKPNSGLKIKHKELLEMLVRIRLVPGSRMPAAVWIIVQGGRGPRGQACWVSKPLERFRRDGEDYFCEFRVEPPEIGWINDTRGHITAQVHVMDIMVIWDGDRPVHPDRVTKWEFKPVTLEVVKP
ncbi:MAG TPA: hypothetical protein VG406_07585 [Isosphaeraceae bacterium]|jgi:hypothetical protein|nr:hypothetical protein [Isosphaeraceae bacterium]